MEWTISDDALHFYIRHWHAFVTTDARFQGSSNEDDGDDQKWRDDKDKTPEINDGNIGEFIAKANANEHHTSRTRIYNSIIQDKKTPMNTNSFLFIGVLHSIRTF